MTREKVYVFLLFVLHFLINIVKNCKCMQKNIRLECVLTVLVVSSFDCNIIYFFSVDCHLIGLDHAP